MSAAATAGYFQDFAAGLAEAGAAAPGPPATATGWLGDAIGSALAATTGGVTGVTCGVTEATGGVKGSTRGVTNSLRDAIEGGLRSGGCTAGPWAAPASTGRASGRGVGRGVLASGTRRSAAYSLMIRARVSSPLRCNTSPSPRKASALSGCCWHTFTSTRWAVLRWPCSSSVRPSRRSSLMSGTSGGNDVHTTAIGAS